MLPLYYNLSLFDLNETLTRMFKMIKSKISVI